MDTAQNLKPNPLFKAFTAIKIGFSYALEWRTMVIWFACSVLATYSGPFGTYLNYSSFELLATWMLLIGVGIVVAYVVYELCNAFLPNVPPLVCNLIFFTVSATLIGVLVNYILLNLLNHTEPEKPTLLLLILYSFATLCFVQIVRKVLLRGNDTQDFVVPVQKAGSSTSKSTPYSRLAQRLDIPKDVRIDYVSANGHFIEVYTGDKKYTTRMRFSDAIAELDGSIGLTVHRSHWVNRDAIKGWVTDTKKPYVLLENEARLPVSKTNFDKVAKEGLLEIVEQ